MFIDRLELEGFRNYVKSGADFISGVNVITGGNAQGKTNLLEAICLCCAGKSFRARSDKELIGFNLDISRIKASGECDGRPRRVELELHRAGRRLMWANGVKLRTASELAGGFSSVLFSPDDLELIRGGATERRRFMDMCLCQLRPRYAKALRDFNRTYEGKTRILRDSQDNPGLFDLISEYNMRLCELSAVIIHYRAMFIDSLAPKAAEIHGQFSSGEKLEIRYKTVSTISDPLMPAQELLPMIISHQESHLAAERASGMCLTGAHKDDIEIYIDGAPARGFASQGQARTAALSLKLAEREIHYAQRGEYPILLLDDVLSELDSGRQDFILNRIGGGQVFITCCEDAGIASRTGGRVITISGGKVEE